MFERAHKTVFDERDELKRENERLEAVVAHHIALGAAKQRIVDAAVADAIVNGAHRLLGNLPLIDQEARLIVCQASMETMGALQEAIKEYRKLTEGA